ncbi:MAG TPA: hypothetical protein VFV52_17420 [Bacilli bacterium]|nr:hypothetical protein [Bacilli bacterium]
MSFWEWILQVLVFFVVLKVAQVIVWNLRRSFYVHPWAVEGLVAILVMGAIALGLSGWWTPVVLGLLFGVVRGDQEEGTTTSRQLL